MKEQEQRENQLKTRVGEREDELKTCKEELEKAKENNFSLTEKIEEQEKKEKDFISTLRNERDEINKLIEQIKQQEQKENQLKFTLGEIEKKINKWKKKLKKCKVELEKEKDEINKLTEQMKEQEQRENQLKTRVGEREDELKTCKEELEKAKDEINKLTEQMKQQEQKENQLKFTLGEIEKKINKWKKDLEEWKDELEKEKVKNFSLTEKIEEQEKKEKDFISTLRNERDEINKLTEQMKQQEQKENQLKFTLGEREKEINKWKKEHEECKEELEKAKDKINKLTEQMKEQEEKENQLKTRVGEREDELKTSKEELEKAKDEINKLIEQMKEQEQRENQLKFTLCEIYKEINKWKKDLEECKEELEKEKEENQKLQNKVKTELEKQKDQLLQKLKDVETKRKENKEEVQRVDKKITERKNSDDDDDDDDDVLLGEKEKLLKSQWKLDEEKKLYERQILTIEKALEPIEIHMMRTMEKNKNSGESQQTDSVTVTAGEVAVLPLFLNPPKDATKMTVEWGRPDLKPRFVFVNLDGSVSSPAVSLSGLDVSSSGVMLDCSAAGWYPEPELLWLDADGNIMSAGPAEKSSDPDGVYTVSSRVTVEKRNYNNFTCRVQQRDINQSRETHIHVPETLSARLFSPRPFSHQYSPLCFSRAGLTVQDGADVSIIHQLTLNSERLVLKELKPPWKNFIKNKGDDAFRKVIFLFSSVNSSTLLLNALTLFPSVFRMILAPQSLSLKPSIKAFVFAELMICFLLLGFTCTGESLEATRPRLVAAMEGDDVVLPCHLGVTVDPDELVVEWGRMDLNPRFVFMWFEGSENINEKNAAYKGRTSVFTDRLKDGDVSLRLTAVKHSDNGRFRCYNPKEIQQYYVDLIVGSVSSPAVSLSGLDVSSSGVMLDCSAAGWYPEPELLWLDADGNIMSAGPAEKSSDPDGVYTVSSRVTVEKRNYNNFTCRVQQRDINQSRETHIHVPDGFFVSQPDCSVSIGSIVILVFTLFIGAAGFIWKWRQTENSKKKLKGEMSDEKKQLMKKEKDKLSEKKSKLEEEIKYRNEDQRIIDQLIELLMMMSEDLKNQRKTINDQREKTEKMIDEDEKKFNKVIDEERNQTGNKMEYKAEGYLKLKEMMTEILDKLDKSKKDHQQVELMTEKLIDKTSKDVDKLKEMKQKIEKNVQEIKKQLEEMKT
ncbi:uncharacterized protein LOC129351344 [Poeciliopsis prolifica]|uniref:uncharacterized protein LOC129351344 n=1 Tax=Poeciliopsis prolifica TaxID=188132 RepID=UPI002413E15A|nr:uncharacterized protein LOC129351344 [Poeciliopsis prolifica]